MTEGRAFGWLLLGVTLLGAGLRVVHLDGTFGFDEVASVRRFVQGGPPAILSLYSGYGGSTSNHLVNSLLAWGSARLLGPEVWALRLPAFLFGVASVPLLGVVARRLTGDRRAGAIAALLAAASPILVAYSPACRGYATLIFFVLGSVWLLLAALEGWSLAMGALLAAALLLVGLSHMSGLVFAGGCGLATAGLALHAWRRGGPTGPGATRGAALRTLAAVALGGVALVAWYSRGASIVSDVGSRVVTGEFEDPSLAGLKSMVSDGTGTWIEMTGEHFLGTGGSWLALLVPLVLLGLVVAARERPRSAWLLLVFVGFPPLALLAGRMMPVPRYFLFVQPFVLVLLALALSRLAGWLASRAHGVPEGALAALLALGAVLPALPLLRVDLEGPGTTFMGVAWDVEGAVEHIARELEPTDVVVGLPRPKESAPWRVRAFEQVFRFHEQLRLAPLQSRPELEGERGGPRRVWFVTPMHDAGDGAFLPESLDLELAASPQRCRVFLGEVAAAPARVTQLPDFAGRPDGWSWYDPFEGVELRHGEAGRASLVAGRGGAVGELVSPPVRVEPGQVVDVWAEVGAVQRSGLRPFARVVARFLDAAGEELSSVPRMAPEWEGLTPSGASSFLRLATLAPRGAHSVEIRLGLADGTSAGDVITFGPPTLILQ